MKHNSVKCMGSSISKVRQPVLFCVHQALNCSRGSGTCPDLAPSHYHLPGLLKQYIQTIFMCVIFRIKFLLHSHTKYYKPNSNGLFM